MQVAAYGKPAHFCGVVGLKPTYGRVSRYGLIAYGSSLDCVGPLAGCVEDAALILQCIAGELLVAVSFATSHPFVMGQFPMQNCRPHWGAALLLCGLSTRHVLAGRDHLDATSSHLPVPEFTQGLEDVERFASRPLHGKRIGIIQETLGLGVSPGVNAAFVRAARHLESLGAEVHEVQSSSSQLMKHNLG